MKHSTNADNVGVDILPVLLLQGQERVFAAETYIHITGLTVFAKHLTARLELVPTIYVNTLMMITTNALYAMYFRHTHFLPVVESAQ